MSLDIIKQYLVSIGFNVDNSSFSNTQQKMNDAEKTVKTFAKNNSNSVASMKSSVGDIGELTRVSMMALSKIFPGMKGPLNEVMGHINLVKQVFDAFSKSVKSDMNDANDSINKFQSKTSSKNQSNGSKHSNFKGTNNKPNATKITPLKTPKSDKSVDGMSKGLTTISKSLQNVSSKSEETGVALKSFEAVGGEAIGGFSLAALGPIAAIAAGIAAIVIAGKKLTDFLGGLANDNLHYQMLARQLWTTTQNAKEVDMALKTMGVTMQDLWLSPQLLQQFNQLRKDSDQLKLPDSFNKNIQVVQELGFEFQRLKQAGSLAFQWIGAYILQYLSGPLVDIKQDFNGFVNGFLKAIPSIGKIIGTGIGVIARLFLDVGDAILFVARIFKDVFSFITGAIDKIPAPIKNIIKIIGLLILAINAPWIALLLFIDDVMTYFRGGKSVIGSVIDYIKGKAKELESPFISFGRTVKSIFQAVANFIKTYIINPIEYVINKIEDAIKAINKAAKDVKDLPGNAVKKAESIPGDALSGLKSIGNKIGDFVTGSGTNYSVPSTSAIKNTTSSSSSVANSNNKVSNQNTFNVYGTNPTTTAKTIGKTLTGIQTHNLQGVY